MRSLLALLGAAWLVACSQQTPGPAPIDPLMYGTWNLDVSDSHFGGGDGAPTSGIVNWSPSGWAFAIAFPGGMYADAIAVDRGCTLVGVQDHNLSCTYEVITPRHVRIRLLANGQIRRQGDIELLDDHTERAVHHVTSPNTAPYDEITVWHRG